MERQNSRGIQFDSKLLKKFLNIKRAEKNMNIKQFYKFLQISQNTVYSCVYNGSMECITYQKMKKRFGKDQEFLDIFGKDK